MATNGNVRGQHWSSKAMEQEPGHRPSLARADGRMVHYYRPPCHSSLPRSCYCCKSDHGASHGHGHKGKKENSSSKPTGPPALTDQSLTRTSKTASSDPTYYCGIRTTHSHRAYTLAKTLQASVECTTCGTCGETIGAVSVSIAHWAQTAGPTKERGDRHAREEPGVAPPLRPSGWLRHLLRRRVLYGCWFACYSWTGRGVGKYSIPVVVVLLWGRWRLRGIVHLRLVGVWRVVWVLVVVLACRHCRVLPCLALSVSFFVGLCL